MCAATVPVERLKALAVRFGVQCGVERDTAGAPVPDDVDEKPTFVPCPEVGFVFGDSLDAGSGTLHVTAKRVIWVSSIHSDLAFVLRYPQIMMHAVSRDTSSFPKPCIYIQLDDGSEDMGQEDEGSDDETEVDQDADVAAEVRLVPLDIAKIDEIFKLLCDYAALNPDSDAEAEGEGDFYFDEAEVYAGLDKTTRAQVMAARMQGSLGLEDVDENEDYNAQDLGELEGVDDSRFEDDEEEDSQAGQNSATANGNAQS